MEVIQFISENAASALKQIHRQLGPEAVVLSVRPLPAPGVARFWQRHPRIEVLAGLPDKPTLPRHACPVDAFGASPNHAGNGGAGSASDTARRWQSIIWLEAMGLLPLYANRLQNHLNASHPAPPTSLEAEWDAVSAALNHFWSEPEFPATENSREPQTHVFVGPPGSGKTTVLCKWLTLAVLTEGRSASVWRLDGPAANTAEMLTVHCEMLGVPVERFWSDPAPNTDLRFVDLPGIEATDARAVDSLRSQLAAVRAPKIHLVLNAAYETDALLAQWRAFGPLEPTDLIISHLDEEPRRIKLWNLVFGTNCTIRFLSAGQKIPGEFRSASPECLFPAQIVP